MIRTAYRAVYLIVLVAVLARLLVYPAGWEEERLPISLLIALHVREAVAASRALWKTGRRRLRLWQKRRRARRTKSRVKVKRDLVALAAQMLPDPEPWPWVEEAAMTALKVSLHGLFTLIPEAVCAKLFLCVRWVGGVRCPKWRDREVAFSVHWLTAQNPTLYQMQTEKAEFSEIPLFPSCVYRGFFCCLVTAPRFIVALCAPGLP